MNTSGMMCVAIIALLIVRKAWYERKDSYVSCCLILSSVGIFLGACLSRLNLWFAMIDLWLMVATAVAYYVVAAMRKKNAIPRCRRWCTGFSLAMLAWICFAVVYLLVEVQRV